MIKTYKIIDILHSGLHGERYSSKVGDKYDVRRNKITIVDTNEKTYYGGLLFNFVDCDMLLYTTPFIKEYGNNNYHFIETVNSIYKLKEV